MEDSVCAVTNVLRMTAENLALLPLSKFHSIDQGLLSCSE